jgi:hypothetical protein
LNKLILLLEGSLILLNLSLLYAKYETINQGKRKQEYLKRIIYIRHVDITYYDSVDFDDVISTLSYFIKLYQFLPAHSEKEVDFTDMLLVFKRGSDSEVQAQRIMRSTAEKIHGALRDFNPDSLSTVLLTTLILDVMLDALDGFHELLDKHNKKYLPVNPDTKKDAGV